MKYLLFVLALNLLSGDCIAQTDLEQEISQIIEEVTRQTEDLVDRAGDPDPKRVEKARKKILAGIKDHEMGRYKDAIKNYQKAIKLDPLNGHHYYEMAFSYSMLGEQRNALRAAVKAQVLAPKFEQIYVVKANILDDLGLTELAIKEYKRLIDIQPNSLMGHINLGVSLRRLEDLVGAEACFLKAIEIEPEHPSAYLHLSVLAQLNGHNYEEKEYLEQFVRYGQNDRRLQVAEKRLAELDKTEIAINPEDPYPHIEMMVAMHRQLWRKKKHKQVFPEAKGYFPSIEEESSVYEIMLEMWKTEKLENNESKHALYDYLVLADANDQLDSFVYFISHKRIPDLTAAYFKEFPDKKDSFYQWAMDVGLIKKASAEDEQKQNESLSVVELAMLFLTESETLYEIKALENDESQQYFDREVKRFRRGLKLQGESKVSKKTFRRIVQGIGQYQDFDPILDGLRYVLPSDDDWDLIVNQLSRYHRRMVDNPIPALIPGALGEPSTQIHLQLEPGSTSFLAYWVAKSVFQNEPDYRSKLGITQTDSNPTVFEEFQAVTAAVQGYIKAKAREDFDGPNDFFEFLVPVYEANCLEGFVLYEIIHKYYGVRLEKLTDSQNSVYRKYAYEFATAALN